MAHDKPFITGASLEAIKRGEDKSCAPNWCKSVEIKDIIMGNFIHTYDPTSDGQEVKGEWYAPKWGCDTLDHVLDAISVVEVGPRNTPNMAERTLLHVASERDRYREALEKILQFDETKGGLMLSIAKRALKK